MMGLKVHIYWLNDEASTDGMTFGEPDDWRSLTSGI